MAGISIHAMRDSIYEEAVLGKGTPHKHIDLSRDRFIPSSSMSKSGKDILVNPITSILNGLVGNYARYGVGRKHLQANVARFDRDSIPSKRVPHKFNHVAPTPTSFVSAVKGVSSPPIQCFVASFGLMIRAWLKSDLQFLSWGRNCLGDIEGYPLTGDGLGATFIRLVLNGRGHENLEVGKVFRFELRSCLFGSQSCKEVPEVVHCSDENPVKNESDINVVDNTVTNERRMRVIVQAIVVVSRVFEEVEKSDIKHSVRWSNYGLFHGLEAQGYGEASSGSNGDWGMFGVRDFNEVRCKEDRWGSTFLAQGASMKQLQEINDPRLCDCVKMAKVRLGIEGDDNSIWRSWIQGSLNSGKASVLVNGSPTSEFQFHRGLKQGAPFGSFFGSFNHLGSLFIFLSPCLLSGYFSQIRIGNGLQQSVLERIFGSGDCTLLRLFTPNVRGGIEEQQA
ncbi:hypothetical protein Tco_0925621 [Tanacetum coccineum]|uniref:Uncharacterized protein n=1 Tax=Tanacetum coccineum TaxID=301880 RepID=A0ABQ5D8C6_9ASTR